ncbi:hypothetical protein OEZ86_009427 [Tetradesmus obliquus]|nr:hypothetical protein OEZ86_009427 [Tetradesmus obliquus]
MCYRGSGASWSPWHANGPAVEPLRKGSAEAAAVAAMLAEEGLDPQTAAAVMAFLHKEKRAPGLAAIRGRIQRFKAVIAPYRRPGMLLWLRKCPRLLNNAEATLAAAVAALLGLLSPGLMLPSQAHELLDRCPQLATRTAVSTKAKLAVFVELFGARDAAPLLLRFPVILTMSTERIRKAVKLLQRLLSDDCGYSRALLAKVLLCYPAFFIHAPERVAANYEAYKQMEDIWACSSGSVTSMLAPLMLPEWQFTLLSHRLEWLRASSKLAEAKAKGISLHNMASPTFEERFPGFADWRAAAKSIPAPKTLQELPLKPCKKKKTGGGGSSSKTGAKGLQLVMRWIA